MKQERKREQGWLYDDAGLYYEGSLLVNRTLSVATFYHGMARRVSATSISSNRKQQQPPKNTSRTKILWLISIRNATFFHFSNKNRKELKKKKIPDF